MAICLSLVRLDPFGSNKAYEAHSRYHLHGLAKLYFWLRCKIRFSLEHRVA